MELEFEELDPEYPEENLRALAVVKDPPIVEAIGGGFRIDALLTFLPDVRLKAELDAEADAALAIVVTGEQGLAAADAAMPRLREKIAAIEDCFEEPTSLANQLHKRMTGLRADFCRKGQSAVAALGRRIFDEKRRLDELAHHERMRQQQEADRLERERAAAAAKQAEAAHAPAPVVEQLKQAAKTATAPPVAARAVVPLRNVSTVANWKARVAGTPNDAEPNPTIADMTPQQQECVLRLLDAIRNGTAPLAAIEVNWSYVNARAKADQKAFNMPGLEAFDAGGVRGKGRR